MRLSELRAVQAEPELGNAIKRDGVIGRDVWFRGYGNVRLHGHLAKPSYNNDAPAGLLFDGYAQYGTASWAER